MNSNAKKVNALSYALFNMAAESGLTWDDAIESLGHAAKALADGAVTHGGVPAHSAREVARQRLEDGFSRTDTAIQVVDDGDSIDSSRAHRNLQ